MRAGYFILSLLIHYAVITKVYAQQDEEAEGPSSDPTDAILMVAIVVGSLIIICVLAFMCCPNLVCRCCPDFVRYCCIGYPDQKAGYTRQPLNQRKINSSVDPYNGINPNENKDGNIRMSQSRERVKFLEDNRGIARGNQPGVKRVHFEPIANRNHPGVERVQYEPVPQVFEAQVPPIVAPHGAYPCVSGYSRPVSSSFRSLQPTLTPGPCPPCRYSLPMMPVGQSEVLLRPAGQYPPAGQLGVNDRVLY